MKAAKAKSLFRGEARLNCAQAVLKTFQKECEVSEDDLCDARSLGGGKADGGICGALCAARLLLNDPAAAGTIEAEFLARAGSMMCKEIRKLKKLPCPECVAFTAELLQGHLR